MHNQSVRLYSTEDTPRLRYIAGIILGDILGLSWEITADKRKLGKFNVINYSAEDIIGSFKIIPDTLLFEKGIRPRELVVDEWKELPVFFPVLKDSDIPFDIFAASFFLISRYEEYYDFQPDEHGRFPASSSLAFKNGFLGIPVVDLWVKMFARALLSRFDNLAFKRNEYKAILTSDVDEPFSYLGKGLLRSIGGLFRDIKNKSGNVSERYNIIAKGEKDPYEVFDYMIEAIEREKADVRFFFPVGDHSEFDKNPSWRSEEYRKLIRRIAGKYKSGLHPSYHSADNASTLSKERERLKTILNDDINCCRFHFIRLFIPQSYQAVHAQGIREDYSMGYPDEPGFRAGIAHPFNFFDLSLDKETKLKIIPFQVMDVTLSKYKNLDTENSKEVIRSLINETRKVGGLFVSIWHNTSLVDNKECQNQRTLFEYMLNIQSS